MDSAIDELKAQLDKLPEGSSKREEVEKKLSKQTNIFNQTKTMVELLEIENQKETAFEIRSGFFAKLNMDGSRSIKNPENFSLKLPSNTLPFTGLKNLRTVNLAFVCDPLNRLGIMDNVFSPNLNAGTVPSKSHRDTCHFILKSLGISDQNILSEKDIAIVNRDLSRIMHSGALSPREHLIELGLYDVTDQSFDLRKFKTVLEFAKENRGMRQERFSEELHTFLTQR